MFRAASIVSVVIALVLRTSVEGFSPESSRRSFVSTAVTSAGALVTATTVSLGPAIAAPTIYNLPNGIKYAILEDVKKGSFPREGDIIAIEYTAYLTNGAIFDATYSIGKRNALVFKLGNTAVTNGINAMVSEMKVGQKVQAIIPPELAFGEKGVCIEEGECLVPPGATIVYDIFLKKASIPPP